MSQLLDLCLKLTLPNADAPEGTIANVEVHCDALGLQPMNEYAWIRLAPLGATSGTFRGGMSPGVSINIPLRWSEEAVVPFELLLSER